MHQTDSSLQEQVFQLVAGALIELGWPLGIVSFICVFLSVVSLLLCMFVLRDSHLSEAIPDIFVFSFGTSFNQCLPLIIVRLSSDKRRDSTECSPEHCQYKETNNEDCIS